MSGTEHPTDPLPDLRAGWVLAVPETPRPRRRVWPWIVGVVGGVILLVILAVVIVEIIAKPAVEREIASQVRTSLGLDDSHPVQVGIPGLLTPQLLAGSLGEITVSSDDVPLGPAAADVTVTMQDVAVAAPHGASGGTATVILDESQLEGLMDSVAQFDLVELSLASPHVVVGTELSLFGIGIPIELALLPGAAGGDLTLTADALTLGGISVTAEQVRSQFGGIADPVLQDWQICIAQYLPAGITLTSAEVVGDEVVASVDIAGDLLADPALQALGSCG